MCDKGGEKTFVEDTNLLVWESFVNGKIFHGHHERLLLFWGYEDNIKVERKEDEDTEGNTKVSSCEPLQLNVVVNDNI